MKGGYYRMFRGWMDNPVFEKEPLCRRAAWVWLIENAAWEDKSVWASGRLLPIRRGQLCHSFRHLADEWGWSVASVQRYIRRLETDTMIDTHSDTGRMVITICNYDKYQVALSTTGTVSDTETDTDGFSGTTDTPTDTLPDTLCDTVSHGAERCNAKAFRVVPSATDTPRDTATDTPTDTKLKELKETKNPPKSPKGGCGGKGLKVDREYTAEEDAGIRAVKDAYPQRAGQQGWKDANRRMADIVASGRATWDDLLRITRAHAQQAAKAGKVGTDKVPMASTYFGEQKGYWSEDLEKLKPSAPSNVNDIYRKALTDYRNGKTWDLVFGPPPRAPGCDIPPELINEILGAPKLTVVATA